MESNTFVKSARKKRRYTTESKFFEADSAIITTKKRSDTYLPRPTQPLHEWESQHEIDQFDDEQK